MTSYTSNVSSKDAQRRKREGGRTGSEMETSSGGEETDEHTDVACGEPGDATE